MKLKYEDYSVLDGASFWSNQGYSSWTFVSLVLQFIHVLYSLCEK